jgi:hypothetical protein
MRESKKFTYLERIEMEQQRRPIPTATTYKLEKSPEEQMKLTSKSGAAERKPGEKRFFYEDASFLSDQVPGPGFYCPHEEIDHVRKSKGDWKYWTKRHANNDKLIQKR